MPPLFLLRPFAEADLATVRALHERAFTALAAAQHSPAQLIAHGRLIAAPDYAEDLRRSHLMLAVGEAEGEILASAGWLAVAEEPGTARIRKVFVEPRLARQGLASHLVRDAEARARAEGYRRLIVRANLNAVPLYERLGYRALRSGTMATPDGTELPVTFMERVGPPDDLGHLRRSDRKSGA